MSSACSPRPFFRALAALGLAFAAACPAATWTYRGQLDLDDRPANGRFALRLTLFDAASGGRALAGPVELPNVGVVAGAFSADFDLPPGLEQQKSLWLQVEAAEPGGNYVAFAERSAVAASTAVSGVCWDVSGNSGTVAGTNFLGSSDNVAVDLRTNNVRGMRLQPSGVQAPNIVTGAAANSVGSIAHAAAIIGGGTLGANAVWDNDSVVVGGSGNQAGADNGDASMEAGAVVVGGLNNKASFLSVALGGDHNTASNSSIAMGENAKAITPFSFVWSDDSAGDFTATASNQFMIRSAGGVGINGAPAPNATLTITNIGSETPAVRLFNRNADQAGGGEVRFTENGSSTSGGAVMKYDAAANQLLVGTNGGGDDAVVLTVPRSAVGLGVKRTPTANSLEVSGNASKDGGGTWDTNSDARIKRDIRPVAGAVDTLLRVRPVTFEYTDAYRASHPGLADRRYYNVVAQEFAEVFPEAVKSSGETLPGAAPGAANEILQVDIHPAVITTMAAVQELAVAADARDERIAALSRENADLRARIERLEQVVREEAGRRR